MNEKSNRVRFLLQDLNISSAIGINAYLSGNWVIVAFYLAAGVIGTEVY